MVLKIDRLKIFFILIVITVFFAFLNRINFIIGSETTTGEVIANKKWGTRSYRKVGGSYSAPIVKFNIQNSETIFQGETNLDYNIGEKVSVIYKKADPTIAEIYTFNGFWLTSFLWSLLPILIITAAVFSFFNKSDVIIISLGKKISVSKTKKDLGIEKAWKLK